MSGNRFRSYIKEGQGQFPEKTDKLSAFLKNSLFICVFMGKRQISHLGNIVPLGQSLNLQCSSEWGMQMTPTTTCFTSLPTAEAILGSSLILTIRGLHNLILLFGLLKKINLDKSLSLAFASIKWGQ